MYSFKGKREWKHLSDILWLLRWVRIFTRKQSEKGISYWKAQTHPETPRGLFRPWLALEIKFVIDTLSWKKRKEKKESRFPVVTMDIISENHHFFLFPIFLPLIQCENCVFHIHWKVMTFWACLFTLTCA